MNRTNQILAAVLVVQIILVGVAFWPRGASFASGEPLFPGIEADQIVRLTISDAGGEQIQLAKKLGSWVLPEADDYATQEDKVPNLVDKIVALKADRLITQTPDSHKRLKVADDTFERRIEFELEDGTTHTVYLGTSPTYRVIHVRAAGQDEVYLVSGLSVTSDVGVQATNWVNPTYFSVPEKDIVAITLENKQGRFEFEKDDEDKWTMKDLGADEEVIENNVTSLATRVSSVRLQRPLGQTEKAGYDMGDPNAVVTIKTRDDEGNEKTYTLRVGGQIGEDKGFVLKSSESPYYVEVAKYTVETLVERGHDDYARLPETPTPETSSTS